MKVYILKKDKKKAISLKVFMLKEEFLEEEFESHLNKEIEVISYPLNDEFKINGKIFIKKQTEKEPIWLNHLKKLSKIEINDLKNTSTSAVLFIKNEKYLFAFTFGYGRYLINDNKFIQDFGIKSALNTLNHESLKSIDLHSFDDQPIQKKAQVTKASGIETFGIDISKDILRAVTGTPNENVPFRNISGGDSVFSFTVDIHMDEIANILDDLFKYYNDDNYKKNFSWVDNIKRITIKNKINELDEKLFNKIKDKNMNITIHVPEIINWDEVSGFSFTRSKKNIKTVLSIENFYENNDNTYNINMFNSDYLYVHYNNDSFKSYSLYKSIYFEISEEKKTYILFSGSWYEIEKIFIDRINTILSKIEISDLEFLPVHEYEVYDKKNKENKITLEKEGDYNLRIAEKLEYYLLDKKLVKTNRTTTSIEICDLLTEKKQLIHVKHMKGGSAGLSHLFAQGNVSAEILLGDREFRKKSRQVLGKIKKGIEELIPINRFNSRDYEIVYLILGVDKSLIKKNLPFFSKVNLSKAFENLSQRGFKVSLSSVSKKRIDE